MGREFPEATSKKAGDGARAGRSGEIKIGGGRPGKIKRKDNCFLETE